MVPQNSVPMDKWSPTNLVPLDKWSPANLVPWTNGPQKFGPPGQMVPNQFGPHISKSSQPVPMDKQNILGTICPGGQNWLGTVCPEGPINWGPIVGDQMSGDHICLGINVSQLIMPNLCR